MTTLRKGNSKDAKRKGYKQKSARSWSEAEMKAVMQYPDQRSMSCSGMQLLRYALVMAFLWQTQSTGNDAGMWRLDNIRLPTGDVAV